MSERGNKMKEKVHSYSENLDYTQVKRALAGESHLGESLHVVAHDLRVGTLQFADDFKALIELREHVHHGAGEQSVL